MPFDNANPARAYFRESTAALAALVETRPAADVLRAVHAELVHRDRRAAVALRDQVAALLSAEVVPVAKPRISVTAVLRPVVVSPVVVQPAPAPVAVSPVAKPRAAKAPKRPGDIGWRPRSLAQIARYAGLAPIRASVEEFAASGGNVLLALREHGLRARGFVAGATDREGYATWSRGAEVLRVGPFGAIYLGADGWQQLPRADRDALAEDGRPGLAAAIVEMRRRAKRKNARAAWRQACATKRPAADAAEWLRSARRDAVRRAWQARAEARAA